MSRPALEKFFRRCQGQLTALYTLDTPVKWESAELDAHRTELFGGAAAAGSGGPQAQLSALALPASPQRGRQGRGGGRGEPTDKVPAEVTQQPDSAKKRSGRQHASTPIPGGREGKARPTAAHSPRGGVRRARSPVGGGQGGHRRPAQGTDRAETEQGRPIREPAVQRMAKEGTARAASGRGARQRAQEPERKSRGEWPRPGDGLGARRRTGTAQRRTGAARRSGRSTRNAGESRTRSAQKKAGEKAAGPTACRALPLGYGRSPSVPGCPRTRQRSGARHPARAPGTKCIARCIAAAEPRKQSEQRERSFASGASLSFRFPAPYRHIFRE